LVKVKKGSLGMEETQGLKGGSGVKVQEAGWLRNSQQKERRICGVEGDFRAFSGVTGQELGEKRQRAEGLWS
jgi:hypothetical protein